MSLDRLLLHRLLTGPCVCLLVLVASGVQATQLEITSDVVEAEIVVSGDAGSYGGAAPLLLTNLPAGRYDIELFAHGRSLGHRAVDVGYQTQLRGSLGSRWLLSTLVPGLGQWRDEGWREAWVPAAGVLLPLARSLHFAARASDFDEQAEALASADLADPDLFAAHETARAEADFARETRGDYLRLSALMHVGNILSASVRRGEVQFRSAGRDRIQALHRPVRTPTAVVLSSVWPGLGQLRAGHRQRAQFWHLATLTWGAAMAELQRDLDESVRDQNILLATSSASDPGFDRRRASLAGEIEDARRLRNHVAILGGALWLANLFDAAFASSSPPVDSDPSLALAGQRSGPRWSFEPGWVGESAGVVVSRRF